MRLHSSQTAALLHTLLCATQSQGSTKVRNQSLQSTEPGQQRGFKSHGQSLS
eukprot:m.118412 g.118412  ORF g.118412 m.118412 type:complete len:52 (+) comp16430_c1_seq3:832-987(+)